MKNANLEINGYDYPISYILTSDQLLEEYINCSGSMIGSYGSMMGNCDISIYTTGDET